MFSLDILYVDITWMVECVSYRSDGI